MMVEVVAALVEKDGAYLVFRRPPHKARGNLFEFVGGKVEPGETREAALKRECREELDVDISVGALFYEVIHRYDDLTVHLYLYRAQVDLASIRLLEHTEMRWVSPEDFQTIPFCPADQEILEVIRRGARSL